MQDQDHGVEKEANKHRVRMWCVTKGIDEGEVTFKDHDEGRASEGGRQESKSQEQPARKTCTCPTQVHDDEQGRAEVKKGPRQAAMTGRNQEANAKVLEFMQCRRSEHGEQAHRERPDVCKHKLPTRRRTGNHNELCSGVVNTHGEKHREKDLDRHDVQGAVKADTGEHRWH